MRRLRDLLTFAAIEIQERLFPSIKRRNALLLQADYAAETLSHGNLQTVRKVADQLIGLGYPDAAFHGISIMVNHPQLVPSSEFGQEVWTAVVDYAPILSRHNAEHYFENVLAACVNANRGSELEQRAAQLLRDAFKYAFDRHPQQALDRLEGLLALVSPTSVVAQAVHELAGSRTRIAQSKQSRGAGRQP